MMKPVESRIYTLVENTPQSFEMLLEHTWGISPFDLKESVDSLLKEKKIKLKHGKYIPEKTIRTYTDVRQDTSAELNDRLDRTDTAVEQFIAKLPLPHPHDFDWRFSIQGVRNFAKYLFIYHDASHAICVISAPIAYVYLRKTGLFPSISLVERSEYTVDMINKEFGDRGAIFSHDLQFPWPPNRPLGEFDCIIMDPPWYQDYYELFLLRASDILKQGGLIHTALFPPFAKSHGLQDRSSIFSFAHNRGLHLISLKKGLLEYDAPKFEDVAFEQEGYSVSHNWRRGDVATFFLALKYGREHIYRVEVDKWREFRIGQSKLKIRISEEVQFYEPPQLSTVEDSTPYLANISRKYQKRDNIGLWTSTQQAYQIKGADVIISMLESIIDYNGKITINDEAIFNDISGNFKIDISKVKHDCHTCLNTLKEIINRELGVSDESKEKKS